MVYRATPQTAARREAKRAHLLRAARERVAREGFAGLRMSALAREAGVATGTLYRYFPNKAALAVEVFRQVSGGEVEHLQGLAAGSTPPGLLVAAAVGSFAARALRRPRLAYALLAEPAGPEVERERLRYRRAYAEVFAQLIAAGQAAGAFPAQDPALSAAWLVGALGEALVGPLSPSAAGDEAALLSSLQALALRSLGAPPGADR